MAMLSKGMGRNTHQVAADDKFFSKKALFLLSTNYKALGTDLLLLKVCVLFSSLPGMEHSELWFLSIH